MISFSRPQDEAIDYALEKGGCNLFCPPGFGKTLTGLELIAHNVGRTLVFAPLLVAANVWPAEAKKWGYDLKMKLLHGPGKSFDDLPEVCLINYEGAGWLCDQIKKHGNPFSHVVYDEISKFKRPGTSRFRRWRHHADHFDTATGLTGSPVGNQLHDVWGPQYLVDKGETLHPSFQQFKGRWFYEDRDSHKLIPFTGAEEQIYEAMKGSARGWTNDHLDMPELKETVVSAELPPDARAWYDELQKESIIADIDLVADNKAVVYGKHRQIAGGSVKDNEGNIIKLHDAKIRLLEDVLGQISPEPLLLIFEYRHDFDAIQELVSRRPERFGFIHGGTTDRQDMETLRLWNAGELDIFAFHPLSCSYGLNFQDVGHHIVYYTVPASYELIQQSTARLWRQGQEEPMVHVHYLVIAETVDIKTLAEKDLKKARQDRCFRALAR